MAKKQLLDIDAGNLFENSPKTDLSTTCYAGFIFLDDKNLRLCPSWKTPKDGRLKIVYHEDFRIPEYLPINGEDYKITEIGKFTFPKSMESIYIPASITKIEEFPFNISPRAELSKIHVSKDNRYYDSREDCNAIIETATNTLITACNDTIIPDSVEKIGAGAFCDVALKSLYIGPNIVYINSGFADIFGLETIIVSENNRYYDSRENCNAIIETATNTLVKGCKTTKIPFSVKRIGVSSFETTGELKSYCIPANIELIDDYAFCNCTQIQLINATF